MGDLQKIQVSDYMTASLVTFGTQTDIMVAIRKLVENGISGAPVLDDTGHLIGMLSEKDCLKAALNAAYHCEFGGKVADYMSRKVITVDADASIIEVAEMFVSSPFKRYPVIRDQNIVGQISRSDVLRAIDRLGISCNLPGH